MSNKSKKTNRYLWIQYDKWLHLMAGYIVTLTFGLFDYLLLGITITIILAFAKEIRDHFTPGTRFDWWDVLWTLYGIAPAIGILILT